MDLRTCLLAAIVLAGLVLVEVPAGAPVATSPEMSLWRYSHGWPLAWLEHTSIGEENSAWEFDGWRSNASSLAIAVDGVVALSILAMIVWLERRYREFLPLRFGLGTALVVMTLFCLAAAWFGHCYYEANLEAAAMAKFPGGNFNKRWFAPHLFRLWGGTRAWPMFYRVVGVGFGNGSIVTDEAIPSLADLKYLERVFSESDTMNDRQLGLVVDACPGLVSVSFYKVQIGDAGAAHLSRATKLERANFWGTPLGDAGLRSLAECPALRKLWVKYTRVTPRGVVDFLARTRIPYFVWDGTDVDRRELPFLRESDEASQIDYEQFDAWLGEQK